MNPYPSYPPPPGQIMPLAGPGPSAPPAQQPVYVFSLPGAPPGMASASFASSSGGGGDDCCGGGCCSSRSLLQPLRTPTEAALPPLRALGCASLGLGIAFLLNGGWAVMSSIFVIAHGALLVGYTGKSRALEEVVHEVKAASGTACCTRKRHMQLRSLAVAAIVFACMEMLLAMGLGWGLGGGIGQPLSTSFLTDPRNNVRVCNSLQCLSGVTSATCVARRWRAVQPACCPRRCYPPRSLAPYPLPTPPHPPFYLKLEQLRFYPRGAAPGLADLHARRAGRLPVPLLRFRRHPLRGHHEHRAVGRLLAGRGNDFAAVPVSRRKRFEK